VTSDVDGADITEKNNPGVVEAKRQLKNACQDFVVQSLEIVGLEGRDLDSKGHITNKPP
jgi:hypothetical protein